MYHNTSSTQDSNMNLLTSPFDPDQLDYVLGYTAEQQEQQRQQHQEQQQSAISQEPLTLSELQQLQQLQYIQQQQQQQQHIEADIWNVSFMPQHYSPTASVQPLPPPQQQQQQPVNNNNNNNVINDFYNKSPSPQAPVQTENMNTNMSHDFASRSPESSSSTESNLVSPPQQYHPSNNDYSDLLNDSLSIPPPLVSKHQQHHNQHHARRSSSVPPHFHRFKQHQHQLMQVVDPSFPYHHFNHKQPPIQIKRMSTGNTPAQHHPSSNMMDAEAYKTQLDDRLTKVNFDDITVAELKEMLRERGLSATGRKAELMQRLKEEQDLLYNRNNTTITTVNNNNRNAAAAVVKAPGSPALHRRVANISLADSPTNSTLIEKKRFAPYVTPPQRHSSISIAQMSSSGKQDDRMASSLPTASSAYLNDQFMRRKPSTLRNSLDETDITLSESPPPPSDIPPANPSLFYYPTVEKIEETTTVTDDIWDEQMLQNFLNQI